MAKLRMILGAMLILAGIIGIERNLGAFPPREVPKPAIKYVLIACVGAFICWKARTDD